MAKGKKSDDRLPIFSEDCFYDESYVMNDVIFYNTLSGTARELVVVTGIAFQKIVYYFARQHVQIRPDTFITEEQFLEFCSAYGYHLVAKQKLNLANLLRNFKLQCSEKNKKSRQPLITVMGHVNHGKTTLIDYIRRSHVADLEDGSITQKFGFYEVDVEGKKISILDTPGHEAFVHLRSQGVKITDITIIVVAANDGVQNQTVEAILLAQQSNCKIIIALNKIDLPNLNKSAVLASLLTHNIIVQGRYQNTPLVEISAKTGKNVDLLLKTIVDVATSLKLAASVNHYPVGVVIETGFDKFMGVSATVYIIDGLLRVGDFLVFENQSYVVKFIENHLHKHIVEARAAQIVRLYNFKHLVSVGSKFIGVSDLKLCKKIVKDRTVNVLEAAKQKKQEKSQNNMDWSKELTVSPSQEQKKKIFEIILVAENFGVIMAIEKMLEKVQTSEHSVKVIKKTLGMITKETILRAHLSNAIIYSFNASANKNARDLINQYHIKVKYFNIIYLLVEDIEEYMLSQMDPFAKYVQIGKMVVKQVFNITKVGKISGCQVKEGFVNNICYLKVLRQNTVIHEGQISELKQFKQNVKKVVAKNECGVNIAGFRKMEVGDEIIAFQKAN